jgi:hypothetical protein
MPLSTKPFLTAKKIKCNFDRRGRRAQANEQIFPETFGGSDLGDYGGALSLQIRIFSTI